jgi:hypothetical protein
VLCAVAGRTYPQQVNNNSVLINGFIFFMYGVYPGNTRCVPNP